MPEHVRIHGAGQIVSAIPALLGFHPADCLVALFLDREGGRVRCLVRQDLDTPPEQMSRVLIGTATRLPNCDLLAAAYAHTTGEWSAHEPGVLTALTDVQDAGVKVLDTLLIAEGRWWSLMCTNPDCCPPEGQLVPTVTSPVEAARVAAGHRAVAPSRTAVQARYALQQPIPASVLEEAVSRVPEALQDRCHHAVNLLTATTTNEHLAELVVLVQDVHVRDWVLAHLATNHIPDPGQLEVLIQAVLRAPDRLRPVIAGACAAALALAGDDPVGVWAMIDYAGNDRLAQLVAESMLACLPPEELQAVFTEAGERLQARMAEPAA